MIINDEINPTVLMTNAGRFALLGNDNLNLASIYQASGDQMTALIYFGLAAEAYGHQEQLLTEALYLEFGDPNDTIAFNAI